MSFLQILFAFEGRLARRPYFGYGMLLLALMLIPVLVGWLLIGTNRGSADSQIVGPLLTGYVALATIILGHWGGFALAVKRLHDIGMAGAHVVWIYGVAVAAGVVAAFSPAAGILPGVASLGIALWLLLAPGQSGANRYDMIADVPPSKKAPPAPPPPAAPVPSPPRRNRRTMFLVLGGAGAALASVAGLLWVIWTKPPAPLRDRQIFNQALDDLAASDGLRYADTTFAGNKRDITVTAYGKLFGSVSPTDRRNVLGAMGGDFDVIRAEGKLFVRNKNRGRPAADQTDKTPAREVTDTLFRNTSFPDEWTANLPLFDFFAGRLLEPLMSPRVLAHRLLLSFNALPDAPPDGTAQPDLRVRDIAALRAETSMGTLYVSRDPPHRVLSLEPPLSLKWLSRWGAGFGNEAGFSDGVDLFPLTGDEAGQMYDTLEMLTEELSDAVDLGSFVRFEKFDVSDCRIGCDATGCRVASKFTGTMSASAGVTQTGIRFRISLSAPVTMDGRPAGKCTGMQPFALSGDTVSGQVACFVSDAGPVYAAILDENKAAARTESERQGGEKVSHAFPQANTTCSVQARALAVVDVDRLLEEISEEQTRRRCTSGISQGWPGDEKSLRDLMAREGYTIIGSQLSIAAASDVSVQIDLVAEKDGTLYLFDVRNRQLAAYASIEKSGGKFFGDLAQAAAAKTREDPSLAHLAPFLDGSRSLGPLPVHIHCN